MTENKQTYLYKTQETSSSVRSVENKQISHISLTFWSERKDSSTCKIP